MAALLFFALPAAAHDPVESDLHWLEHLAAEGDAEAWYRIGRIKEEGIGRLPDSAGAMAAYRAAAELGYAPAQLRLAQLLASDFEGLPDYAEARRWYAAAAEQGLAEAAYNLAVLEEVGPGGPADLAAAARHYEAAARGGIGAAALQLGLLHLTERLADADAVAGLAWLIKADALGAPGAGELVQDYGRELGAETRAAAVRLAESF